jgi:hypothetical protein
MTQAQVAAPVAGDGAKKQGFFSTSSGRIVAIALGLGALLAIAGIAVWIVIFVFGSQAVDELGSQLEKPPVTSGSASTTVTPEAEAPAAELPNAAVFTFRDIFKPLLVALAEPTSSGGIEGGSTTTTDTVTPTSAGTLYLDGVVTQDGVLMAQLRYDGSSYTLPAGGRITNSPWQVYSVSSTSVVMLYGDNRVTLAVGQGITK